MEAFVVSILLAQPSFWKGRRWIDSFHEIFAQEVRLEKDKTLTLLRKQQKVNDNESIIHIFANKFGSIKSNIISTSSSLTTTSLPILREICVWVMYDENKRNDFIKVVPLPALLAGIMIGKVKTGHWASKNKWIK